MVFDAIVSHAYRIQEFRYEFRTFFVNEAHQSLKEGQFFFVFRLLRRIVNIFSRVSPKSDLRVLITLLVGYSVQTTE